MSSLDRPISVEWIEWTSCLSFLIFDIEGIHLGLFIVCFLKGISFLSYMSGEPDYTSISTFLPYLLLDHMLGTYVFPSMKTASQSDLFPYDRNTYHNANIFHLLIHSQIVFHTKRTIRNYINQYLTNILVFLASRLRIELMCMKSYQLNTNYWITSNKVGIFKQI